MKPSQVSAQTLTAPQGIAVDLASNLYVADTGANRVMAFPNTSVAPAAGAVATFVIGQASFSASAVVAVKTPVDVAVDSSGDIFVADAGGNRVLIFPSLVFLPPTGATPNGVIGQPSTTGTTANWDSPGNGLASADSLYSPNGLYVDRQDTLYVGDVGNNRVLQFLKPGVVVNAATYQEGVPVGQGSLADLFGTALAASTVTSSTPPWQGTLAEPADHDRRSDRFADLLHFGDAGQLPDSFERGVGHAKGCAAGGRYGRTGSRRQPVDLGGFARALHDQPRRIGPSRRGAIRTTRSIAPSNPAPVGSTITLYGTGQGPVSPAVQDGAGAGYRAFVLYHCGADIQLDDLPE